jgi:multiple sugar transport system permease protein
MRHRLAALLLLVLAWIPGLRGQERVTLRLVDWASLEEMPIDERTVAAFEARYPGIRVLYEPNPGRQYEEKILTGLAAGEPPDVFLLDSKLIPTFTNKRVLLDLAPYVGPLGVDTAQWYPGVLAMARKDGALYAFPKGFTPLMIFYNRALFRAAGLPAPRPDWTWEEFLADATALTRDRDGDGRPEEYGTAFTNYYFYWIPWVWSGGGDVVSPDGRTATGYLNSPETERALAFPIGLRRDHRVAPDVGSWIQAEKTGTNYALFANGKIAMIVDGHWRLPKFARYIQDGTLDIGVAPFPRHPSGRKVNVMYESGWCVPVNARHPKEAALLAAFMAGEEACRIRSAARLEIPSVRSVAEASVADDPTGMERVFLDEVPSCRQPWGSLVERFSEIEWTLQDAVDEVMVNGAPMHETMTRYAAKIDGQLAAIREHESMAFSPIRDHSEILTFLWAALGVVTAACGLLYLRSRRRRESALAFAFLAPSILHLVVFTATPILFAAYLSTHRWDIVVPDQPFVGLENFREMFRDPAFWNALGNTFLFSLNVPLGMAVALGVALILHNRLRGLGFLRALYFLPSVSSFVAIALVWMWIYHPSFGAANVLLGMVGLPPLDWLNSSQTAMLSLVLFSVWLGIGTQMVIFLAGLQGIPGELYDAARIDGAGAFQRFRKVTLPLLKPTTFFILVTSLISSFQVFTTVYVMTAGGPVGSTDVIVYHIYKAAWEQLRMGYASAVSWVLFLLIMAATWIQFKTVGSDVDYQ